MDKIITAAKTLNHSWVILDALRDDPNPDEQVYQDTINKISDIEKKYTTEEIEAGDLLVDIW